MIQFEKGIYSIFKPKGMSSFKVIAQLRRITGEKKIGHAGTLDPLASGVLIVAIGKEYTRKIALEMGKEKEYEALIYLGKGSTTDDAEGVINEDINYNLYITRERILENLKVFIGTILQRPPIFSAIKVKGKRAYALARDEKPVLLMEREVSIKNIKIISYYFPYLRVRITCGKGVYIRSIARDLGELLRTKGYLAELSRTRIGEYLLSDCVRIF